MLAIEQAQELHSVHHRHQDVEDHELNLLLSDEVHRLADILRHENFPAWPGQARNYLPGQVQELRTVVNE